jgi:hypothetical protein
MQIVSEQQQVPATTYVMQIVSEQQQVPAATYVMLIVSEQQHQQVNIRLCLL